MIDWLVNSSGDQVTVGGLPINSGTTVEDVVTCLNDAGRPYGRLDRQDGGARLGLRWPDEQMAITLHFSQRRLLMVYQSDMGDTGDADRRLRNLIAFKELASRLSGLLDWASLSAGSGLHDNRPFIELKIRQD